MKVDQAKKCKDLELENAHLMPLLRDDEELLRAEVIWTASAYARYDYRFIASMMRNISLGQATISKVTRIWWQECLKIPQKQPSRGKLWFNECSRTSLKANHLNRIWGYEFVFVRDAYGVKIPMLMMGVGEAL